MFGTDLGHDHVDLNCRVVSLRLELKALQRAGASCSEVAAALGDLREQLFHHFAREESELFSFLRAVRRDDFDEIDGMIASHRTIGHALERMCELAAADAPLAGMVALFERFEGAYVEHVRRETELVDRVGTQLDSAMRARLASMVAELG